MGRRSGSVAAPTSTFRSVTMPSQRSTPTNHRPAPVSRAQSLGATLPTKSLREDIQAAKDRMGFKLARVRTARWSAIAALVLAPLLLAACGSESTDSSPTETASSPPTVSETTVSSPKGGSCGDIVSDGFFLGDVAASGVDCTDAVALVNEWQSANCSSRCTVAGFECATTREEYEFQEWLCTREGAEVRFALGS